MKRRPRIRYWLGLSALMLFVTGFQQAISAREQRPKTRVKQNQDDLTAKIKPEGASAGMDMTDSPVQKYTIQEVFQRALQQNPGLLASLEEVEMARAEARTQEAALWPMISINGQFTAGTAQRMSIPLQEVEPMNMSMRPAGLTANLNLTALYPLFNGGKIQALIAGARLRLRQSELAFQVKQLEVAAQLQQAWLDYRWQNARIDVLQKDKQRQQLALNLAQEQLELGKIPRFILLRSQTELSRTQQQLNLAELEVHHRLAELQRLAALPAGFALKSNPEMTISPQLSELPTADEIHKLLVSRSPELAVLQSQLDEAETRVQLAQSRYYPIVYLAGVYEQRIPDMPQMDYTSGGAVDLLITMPVFDGWKRDAEIEKLKHEQSRLLNLYTDTRNRLQTEADKLLLEMASLHSNLELSQQELAQIEEENRITVMRFQHGKAIQLELLDADAQLRASRLNRLEALYQFESARIRLNQLIALPLE